MSIRPRTAQPNPARGGDGRRLRWSESPIPRVATRRVRSGRSCFTIRPDGFYGRYEGTSEDPVTVVGGAGMGTLADALDSTYITNAQRNYLDLPLLTIHPFVTFPALDLGGHTLANLTVKVRVRDAVSAGASRTNLSLIRLGYAGSAPEDYEDYSGTEIELGRDLIYTDGTGPIGTSWETHTKTWALDDFYVLSPTISDVLEAGEFGIGLDPVATGDSMDFAEITVTVCL